MYAIEKKHLTSRDHYQPNWETPFLRIPDEVTQIILELALRNPNPSTLTLVCKSWSVLLTDICKRLIKKLWPHLLNNKEKNWITVYLQKATIHENIMAGRYTVSILEVKGNEDLFPLNRRSVAVYRPLANRNTDLPTQPHEYIKQLDVVYLPTARIQRVIEIINTFTIHHSILYMDIETSIHAFDIHTHELLGIFSGYQGVVVHQFVYAHNTLLALTAKCENAATRTNTLKEFYLYSWDLETKRKHQYDLGLAASCEFLDGDDQTIWIERTVNYKETYLQFNIDGLQMIDTSQKSPPDEIIRYQDLILVRENSCWKITKNNEPFAQDITDKRTCVIIKAFLEEDRIITIVSADYEGHNENDNNHILIQIWDITTNQKINEAETQMRGEEMEDSTDAIEKYTLHKISESHLLFMFLSSCDDNDNRGYIALVNLYTGATVYKNNFPFPINCNPVIYCDKLNEQPTILSTISMSLDAPIESMAVIDFSKDGEKKPLLLTSVISPETKFISPRPIPQKPTKQNPKRHRCLIS